MKYSIFIPRSVWASRSHLRAIKALTYAPVEPHDKATVESNSEALSEDCKLISEYIEARFEK